MITIFTQFFPFIKKRRFNIGTKPHNPRVNFSIHKDVRLLFPITTICDYNLPLGRKNIVDSIINNQYIRI